VITDSSTYAESISWDNPLTIEAAPGESPVIAGDGVANYVLRTLPGAERSRVGWAAGGRIRIDGDACALPSYIIDLAYTNIEADAVVLEHLTVEVTKNVPNRDDNALVKVEGPSGNVEMRDVELMGGNHGLYLYSTT